MSYRRTPMARPALKRPTNSLSLTLAAQDLKQPLHVRVRQILRERILHDFQHGQRFYSERELIQNLGVSQPTIRRALTDLSSEGYLQPDPRRGFFVQHHAEMRYVGLIRPAWKAMSYLESDFAYSAVCREINYILTPHDMHKGDDVDAIMASITHKATEERLLIAGLTVEVTLALGARLQAEGYRHLVVGSQVPGLTGSSLSMDHDVETDLILDHLLKLGHERIVFMVNEPRILLITSLRAETIQRKLKERKLEHAQIVFCDTKNWESSFDAAYQKTHELMKAKPAPTAVVPLSGAGAWAVLRYAIEHRISVPDQLSVVSFDPMINSDVAPIPITELTFQQTDRARKAIELLWTDSSTPIHIKVAPSLTARKSSGPAPR